MTNRELFLKTNTPSILIKIALEDLEKCEQSELYKIEMSSWYISEEYNSNECLVCLAGSVLAQNFQEELSYFSSDELYNGIDPFNIPDIENKLYALNLFREGLLKEAFKKLNIKMPKNMVSPYIISDYHKNSKLFKKDLLDLIKYLESYGY